MIKRYTSFDVLRILAMFAVCWPHLTVIINPKYNILEIVRHWFTQPLALSNDLGMLGVCIFFILSGFFLSYENNKKRTMREFVLNKFYKLILPLWINIILFFCFIKVADLFVQSYWSQFSNIDWLKSITLFNFITGHQEFCCGVLWYLVPLIQFFLIYIVYKKYSDKPVGFIYLTQAITLTCGIFIKYANSINVGCISYIQFLNVPLFGYIIGLFNQNYLSFKNFIHFSIFNMFVSILCFNLNSYNYLIDNTHFVSVIYSFFLVFFCLMYEKSINKENIIENKILLKLSNISYDFYIVHSLYGGFIISLLYKINYSLSLIIAIFLTIYICILIRKYIENPLICTITKFINTYFLQRERESNF